MDEKVLNWIYKRRSIRKYHSRAVEPEKIDEILKAAMASPSANNRKPWHFIVIQNRKTLDAIAKKHPYAKMVYEAPLVIVVCAEPKISQPYWVQDCAAATENILLSATALGLGSVWLGMHPRVERKRDMRALLNLPEEVEILSMVAIGYGAEDKSSRSQYDGERVHHETW